MQLINIDTILPITQIPTLPTWLKKYQHYCWIRILFMGGVYFVYLFWNCCTILWISWDSDFSCWYKL